MAGAMSPADEDTRAFLQERVALFWKALFAIGLISNVIDVGALISGQSPSMHHLLSGLTTATSAALWQLCRRGRRSVAFSRRVEAIGMLAATIVVALMGRFLVANIGLLIAEQLPDTPRDHPLIDGYLSMMILFGATLMVAIRAALIPSKVLRTVVLTAAAGLPFIVSVAVIEPPIDQALGLTLPTTIAEFRLPWTLAVWWGFTTITCAIISRVIYGLRAEVTEARQLGQYVLERKLGEGGMGLVYRASHGMMRRPSAIKLLPLERAGETAVRRFEREVQLTARLTHPNTITIFDYGRTAEGVFYYAMELLDGATLEDIVRVDGPQHPGRVARILAMVCGSLAEAHGVGLIHRDIKPANIMMCSQGGEEDVVKVLDFGLVKQVQVDQDTELTGADTVPGTPLYMAPEAIQAPNEVDARADIYAVGAVGYYLLTGTDVFVGSIIEVCSQHLRTAPEPPSERLGRALPEDLEALMLRCLAKDPEDRPASARELRDLIDACEVPAWDAKRARDWWQTHQGALGQTADRGESVADTETLAVAPTRVMSTDVAAAL